MRLMKHYFWMALALAVLAAAAGWLTQTTVAQSGNAQLRFVHAIPAASAIDVYIDGEASVSGLELGTVSLYVNVPAGDHTITATQAGVTTPLWQQTVSAAENSAYTLVAASTEPLQFQQYEDDLAPLSLGKTRFTAIHAIADAPPISVVLSDSRPVISGLQYGQSYGTLDLPALTYELAVISDGGSLDQALVPIAPYSLNSGTSYTLLVYGSPTNPQASLLSAAGSSDGATSAVRLAHAVPDAGPVDVFLDATLIAPALTFGSSTEYLNVPAASYQLSVRLAGTQDDLATTALVLNGGERITGLALSDAEGVVTLQAFVDDVTTITPDEAVFNVINALPGTATVTAQTESGEGISTPIESGSSASATVAAATGGATITIDDGEAQLDIPIPLEGIYGGVYYDAVVLNTADGARTLFLPPVSIAQSVTSAPGDATVALNVEITEAATAEATPAVTLVAQDPTAAETVAAPATASSEIVTDAAPAPDQPTLTAMPTIATNVPPPTLTPVPTQPPLPTATPGLPTARVLLDPGANLQLREYPSSEARSLGLAPSGSTLTVVGRQGEPEPIPGTTPTPAAEPYVDPVTQLAAGSDLDRGSTWLRVEMLMADGGTLSAWVNALYVDINATDGSLVPLRSLPTIPSNRAGEASTGATLPPPPTAAAPTINVVVGGLDEGVNLQIRRTPDATAESLTLVPNGTPLEFLGINEDQTWTFVRFTPPDNSGTVTGWASARYLLNLTYAGQPTDYAGLEARGLLEVLGADVRGEVGGNYVAPALPTRDPFEDVVVGEVFLDEGANLQLRRNPDAQSESLGLVPSGARLIITGRDQTGAWLRTDYDGSVGWVSAPYVGLTFNGETYELGDVEIYQSPLTLEQASGTATAENIPTVAPTATPILKEASVVVDTVPVTVNPGGGDTVIILSRGALVRMIQTQGDFTEIIIPDPFVQGWLPTSSIIPTGN